MVKHNISFTILLEGTTSLSVFKTLLEVLLLLFQQRGWTPDTCPHWECNPGKPGCIPILPKTKKQTFMHFTKFFIQTVLQDNNPAEIPAVLNNLVGRTCAFNIEITAYNTNLGRESTLLWSSRNTS